MHPLKRATLLLVAALLSLCGLRAQVNTDHMMMVGRNALYFKDYVLSIQYFNQVINAKPYLYDPYFFRGLAKFYLEDFGGAEADCSESIERNPFVSDSYQVRALSRMQLGKFDEAIGDYRQALSFDPENENMWSNLALCYGRTENYDEALGVLDTLHRIMPSFAPALTMRAQIHIQQNDTVAALKDIAESMALDKYDPDVYSMRAILYLQQKRYAEAEEDLTYALHLMPVSNWYVNRALARYQQADLRGAMADYDTALNMDKNNLLAHFNRGLLRAEVGDDNRAIEDFDFVIACEPDNTIAVFNRALLRAETGDLEGAEQDFTDVLAQYPSFIYGYQCRANVRSQLGKHKESEEDHLVVLKSQLSGVTPSGTKKNDPDANDEDGEVRRKSDHNVKKYKRMVVADDDLALEDGTYGTPYRGKVQNRNIHVEMLPSFVATYYEREDLLTSTLHYHHDLDALNSTALLPMRLLVTSAETALTERQVELHFADIDEQTNHVASYAARDDEEVDATVAVHWFARGLDFYLVQDFISAIADYSSAIAADGGLWVAYFNRAIARCKQTQIEQAEREDDGNVLGTLQGGAEDHATLSPSSAYQLCLADLNKVIDLAPDFAYAWYNRANIYCLMHDYPAALADYNEVIASNPSFAEAYYNRGLTRLFLGQNEEGIADLSKAGELGLYGAYNLIKRFAE